MFDVAFSEVILIAVVALIVIGPERLPKVARTMGHMFGRLQRYVNEVKADINREMELDELRKLKSEVQTAAHDFEHSVSQAARNAETGIRSVEEQLNAADTAAGASASAAGPSAADAAPTGMAVQQGTAAPEEPRQSTLPGIDRI